jgi:hypothetical protein
VAEEGVGFVVVGLVVREPSQSRRGPQHLLERGGCESFADDLADLLVVAVELRRAGECGLHDPPERVKSYAVRGFHVVACTV